MTTKKKTGRPSKFTPEIGNAICQGIIDLIDIRTICKEQGISVVTLYNWLRENPEFMKQYDEAREIQADLYADELMRVARDGSEDYAFVEATDGSGIGAKPIVLKEHIQRSRLICDTLKWTASKLRPKRYGDKVVNEHTGKDGGPIETVTVYVPDNKRD